MAQKYKNVGGIEASDALATLTDGDGAYLDYDIAGGNAHFGAKGGAGSNRGVLIRTLLAGAAVTALAFAASGAATFVGAVTVPGAVTMSSTASIAGLLTANALTVTTGTSALQSVTATTISAVADANVLHTSSATGTAAHYLLMTNTGAAAIIGVERSVGGNLITASSPYDLVINASTNTGIRFGVNNLIGMSLAPGGILTVVGAFGCNGAAPQGAFASGGPAPAGGTGTAAGGWDTAAHRDATITLINNIRTALVNDGILS